MSQDAVLSQEGNGRLDEIIFSLAKLRGASTEASAIASSNLDEAGAHMSTQARAEFLEKAGVTTQVAALRSGFIAEHGFDPDESDAVTVELEKRRVWKPTATDIGRLNDATQQTPLRTLSSAEIAGIVKESGVDLEKVDLEQVGKMAADLVATERSIQIAEKLGVHLKTDEDFELWHKFVLVQEYYGKKEDLEDAAQVPDRGHSQIDEESDRADLKAGTALMNRILQTSALVEEGRELAFKPSRSALSQDLRTMSVIDLERTTDVSKLIEGTDEKTVFNGLTEIHQALSVSSRKDQRNPLPEFSLLERAQLCQTDEVSPRHLLANVPVAEEFDAALNPVNDLVKARLRRQSAEASETIEHTRNRMPGHALDSKRTPDSPGGKDPKILD